MKKYKANVCITTIAQHYIGEVEFDTEQEYLEAADNLWKSQDYGSPSTNCHNDFDLNDWDIEEIKEKDFEFYPNT